MTGQPSYVLTYTGEHGFVVRCHCPDFDSMVSELRRQTSKGLHVAVCIHIPLVTPDV